MAAGVPLVDSVRILAVGMEPRDSGERSRSGPYIPVNELPSFPVS